MTRQFLLPDLGEGLTEAEIVRWLVTVGETVAVDQPVVEVETAKATVEVPSPYAGEVVALHGAEGALVDVGAPLISIGGDSSAGGRAASGTVGAAGSAGGAAGSRGAAGADAAAGSGGAAGADAAGGGPGSGAVLVGYGTTEAPRRNRRTSRNVELRRFEGAGGSPTLETPQVDAGGAGPAVVSPVVRRLAREYGLDLSTLRGSGRGGLIVRADVERAHAAPVPAAAVAERVPLRGLRRAVADKLSRSRREIPDATTWVDVDATGLLAAKQAIGVGILALMARFCVAGLRRFPELNSTVDGSDLVRLPHVNLGFAAQTDRGLVVPVIHDADQRTTADLAAEIARLTAAARSGTLAPAELTGGTFTLNNYGVFGVDGSDAIINHPEAGILGIGRLMPRPWVVDGELAVRTVTQLSLSFDHRVCDGGVAGGFLRYVADLVESPHRLLRDL
jgi:2-oxoisovalerate dehydrogenase E2 component (dihydrolipoyl transacylase)